MGAQAPAEARPQGARRTVACSTGLGPNSVQPRLNAFCHGFVALSNERISSSESARMLSAQRRTSAQYNSDGLSLTSAIVQFQAISSTPGSLGPLVKLHVR